MVAFRLQNFGGMIPAVDDRLLPDNAAAYAKNAWLYSGALEGIRSPQALYTVRDSLTRRVFRIPKNYVDKRYLTDSFWLEFRNSNTDVIPSPIVNDSFKRYYWVGEGDVPRYNTLARISGQVNGYLGSSGYLLGIPVPATAPAIVASGGVSSVVVSRAYVFTYVSEFGEEGAPSPPTLVTGKQDDTFAITLTAPAGALLANRALNRLRIYRTITGSSGVATYYLVAEQPIATTSYNDTATDLSLTGGTTLETTGYTPPPSDLKGIVALPNGMLAGWRENELWYCEPYRPHAWPVAYTLSVEYPIVGLGVIGQALIVCTTATPYVAMGVNPSSVALSKIDVNEPCMSRASIISAPEGVYYASQNGLVLANPTGVRVVTRELITKNRWLDLIDPARIRAARLGMAYYAFGTVRTGCFDLTAFQPGAFEVNDFTFSTTGFLLDPVNQRVSFELLTSTLPTYDVINDESSGEVLLLRDGVIYWLDISETAPRTDFLWRSKTFQTPLLKNLAAVRVWFGVPAGAPALNPTINTNLVQTLAPDQWGLLRVYADDRLVYTRELRRSGELFRLPSGYKAQFWKIEIEARIVIYNIEASTSAKELLSV